MLFAGFVAGLFLWLFYNFDLSILSVAIGYLLWVFRNWMKNKEAERQMMERLEQQRKLELLTCALNLWLHIIVVYLNVLNIVCINLTHCDWRNLRTNCLPMSDGQEQHQCLEWILFLPFEAKSIHDISEKINFIKSSLCAFGIKRRFQATYLV